MGILWAHTGAIGCVVLVSLPHAGTQYLIVQACSGKLVHSIVYINFSAFCLPSIHGYTLWEAHAVRYLSLHSLVHPE